MAPFNEVFKKWVEEITFLLEDSTAHGMERIGSGPPRRSLFWICIFLISLTMVSFQNAALIRQYLSYGKTVSIALRESKLPEYPHITLCSEYFVPSTVEPNQYYLELTKMAKEHLEAQYDDSGGFYEYETLQLQNEYFYGNISEYELRDRQYELQDKFNYMTDYTLHPNKYNFSDFQKVQDLMGFSGPNQPYSVLDINPEDYFFDCTFRGVLCKRSDFSVQSSDTYGNCFTFMSPKYSQMESDTPMGSKLGLRLKVRLPETSIDSRARTKGIRISVHDANQLPSFAEDQGLFTTLGVDAHIKFNQITLKRYDNKREHCNDFWPLESEQLQGLAYSDKVCRKLCIEDSLFSECGCGLSVLYKNIYPERQKCQLAENETQYSCWEKYSSRDVDQTYEKLCDQKCHLPCRDVQYTLSLSSAKYPHRNSLIPELLGYMQSNNELIRNDTKSFLEELVKIYNISNVPTCSRILEGRSHTNTYTLLACLIHQNPLHWIDEIKSDLRFFELLLKVRSMYAILTVTEAQDDHETQTENPEIQLVNLMSEIGGVMGLWVGISVITLIEFLEIFFYTGLFVKSSWKWITNAPESVKVNGINKSEATLCDNLSPSRNQNEGKELTTFVNCYTNDKESDQKPEEQTPGQFSINASCTNSF